MRLSGFDPVGGNHAQLMVDSNAAIDAMVADIDAATDHVHLIFYIWMPDNNGRKMAEALKRAPDRDTFRPFVTGLGYAQPLSVKQGETHFGLIGNAYYIYDYEKGESREFSLDLTAMVPGDCTGEASSAYLYYGNDQKQWLAPLKVEIQPASGK